MPKRFSRCCAISTLVLATVAQADTDVRLDVDTRVEATEGGSNAPSDSRRSLTVTLRENGFVVRSADNVIAYDFGRRKYDVVDPKGRTRVEYSLFDSVGFRVLELRNRNNLSKMLSAAKLDRVKLESGVDTEQALAIQEVPSQPLRVSTEGSDQTYSSDDHLLARVALEGTRVSPADARMFAQFVRYQLLGHPQVLAALASSQSIPARIVLRFAGPPVRTQTVTITAVGPASEPAIDPSQFEPRRPRPGADPIDAILDRGAGLTPAQLSAARKRIEDDIAAAFRDGRVFDALLGNLERNSITGEGFMPMTAEQKAAIQGDPSSRQFLAVIGASRKEELPAAIEVLDRLRPLTTAKVTIVDLTKANDLAMLGKRAEAQALFVAVLDANPCLGGAYKDLGDALLANWDIARAWRSWDVGRRIAPRFPSYSAVDQFERSLAAGHPEYF